MSSASFPRIFQVRPQRRRRSPRNLLHGAAGNASEGADLVAGTLLTNIRESFP
jgi:hypothetical protein